jgi:hypothetical protein
MAVEFEEPRAALDALVRAGIRICKVQVSSALQLDGHDGASLQAALAPFTEDTYLHQVVEHCDGELRRFVDLPDALADANGCDSARKRDWRVHFHVPIFLDRMHGFGTTQRYLLDLLHDVLPAIYRTTDLCTAIARELTWVRTTLES